MRRFAASAATLLLIALAGAVPVAAESREGALRAAILDTLRAAERAGMNGVILIRSRDRVVLHEAFGWADAEARRPMTVATGFDIGSIVKPMTFCAVLALEAAGRLSLSDTLGAYFPEAPRDKAGITLLQMIEHSSGMRDVFGDDYDVVSREWLIRKAMSARLRFRPGAGESYSNSAYALLAIVIEKVAGEPYETFVRREILAPAGVIGIGYAQAGWTPERLAVGYDRRGRRWGTPLDHAWAEDGPGWNLRGNGGMLATAAELCAWYEALFDGAVLDSVPLRRFYARAAGESKVVNGPVVGHAGGNGVFNSLQFSYPGVDVHLTFFTSAARHKAEDLVERFRPALRELAKLALAGSGGR